MDEHLKELQRETKVNILNFLWLITSHIEKDCQLTLEVSELRVIQTLIELHL